MYKIFLKKIEWLFNDSNLSQCIEYYYSDNEDKAYWKNIIKNNKSSINNLEMNAILYYDGIRRNLFN